MVYDQRGAATRVPVCEISRSRGETGSVPGLSRGHSYLSPGHCTERAATDPEAAPDCRMAPTQMPAGALHTCPKTTAIVQDGPGDGSVFGVRLSPMIVGVTMSLPSVPVIGNSLRLRRIRQ